MNEALQQVINRNDTWRGSHRHFQGPDASANSDSHGPQGLSTGYAALDDLYSEANAEYYEGNIAFDRALLGSGNEALREFAKAATAFTRSQAHARQVYEALVPQPTSPTDLGLRPFGGDWATWETNVR